MSHITGFLPLNFITVKIKRGHNVYVFGYPYVSKVTILNFIIAFQVFTTALVAKIVIKKKLEYIKCKMTTTL